MNLVNCKSEEISIIPGEVLSELYYGLETSENILTKGQVVFEMGI